MSPIIYPKKIKASQKEIFKHLELAKKRVHSAEILLKQKEYRDAVSRAYYAFFDAGSALLLTEGLVAKTHDGLLTLLGLHFVKKGGIESEFANFFRLAKEAREQADYEIYKVSKDTVVSLGGIAMEENIIKTDTDFRTQLSKIKEFNPDVLFMTIKDGQFVEYQQ